MARILAVEDNIVQAYALRLLLTRLGHTLTGVVPTAAEAEALFRADPPDLLLLDVRLPGGDDGIVLGAFWCAAGPCRSSSSPPTPTNPRLSGRAKPAPSPSSASPTTNCCWRAPSSWPCRTSGAEVPLARSCRDELRQRFSQRSSQQTLSVAP